jgi:hypothetical protein
MDDTSFEGWTNPASSMMDYPDGRKLAANVTEGGTWRGPQLLPGDRRCDQVREQVVAAGSPRRLRPRGAHMDRATGTEYPVLPGNPLLGDDPARALVARLVRGSRVERLDARRRLRRVASARAPAGGDDQDAPGALGRAASRPCRPARSDARAAGGPRPGGAALCRLRRGRAADGDREGVQGGGDPDVQPSTICVTVGSASCTCAASRGRGSASSSASATSR